jgi:ribosomal protein L11 methyltransferase
MVDNAPLPGHTARLATDRATAQRLADFLTETLDEQDVVTAAFETDDGLWNMAVYFSAPPNETAVRALVALEAGAELANTLVFERIEAKDWVAASLAGLAPVEAGRFMVHGQHDRARVRGSRIGIEIEAALAFGTGHHGTTRGCLLALDRLVKQQSYRRQANMRVLDVGTGSGVLAIAAARALHTRVLASDIDDRAVKIARENARRNRAGAFVHVMHAGGLAACRFRQRAPFALVLANILLAPLRRLATPMAGLVAPGGRVVLSGLLVAQASAALAAYRARGLILERRITLEGWVTLVLRRPARRPAVAAAPRSP